MMNRSLAVWLALFWLPPLAAAAPRAGEIRAFEIDTARSTMEIDVSRGGLFKAFGHDHVIAARELSGRIRLDPDRPEGSSVSLLVAAPSLKVADPEISDKDRAEVQSTLLGEKVLAAARFPEIAFDSGRVTLGPGQPPHPGGPGSMNRAKDPAGQDRPDPSGAPGSPAPPGPGPRHDGWELTLTGTLRLHGVKKEISFPVGVSVDGDEMEAAGEVFLLQTDYGIRPVTAAGGLVKVKDRLRIRFVIRARCTPS